MAEEEAISTDGMRNKTRIPIFVMAEAKARAFYLKPSMSLLGGFSLTRFRFLQGGQPSQRPIFNCYKPRYL